MPIRIVPTKRPSRATTGDRAVQKNRKKRAQDKMTMKEKAMAAQRNSRLFTTGKSKGGKIMKAMGGKMAKGYSKGGAKMMKAMGGKMAKGYSKGGAKMIRAQSGKEIKRPKNMISNVRGMNRPKIKVNTGTDKVSKLVTVINKLPKSGKLALAGGLTAGTIALISKLNPGAKRAGKQVRELKRNKKKK